MPLNSPTHNPCPQSGKGCLFVVATPIGNMDDITLRALKILREANRVAAEDTRHTGKLLARHGIRTPLISYHEHNKNARTPELIGRLKDGETIALVTDAGTPSVSDPGYRLIRAAVGNDIRVIPVPGVSAVIAALSVSGLPTDAFVFAGFPARRKGKRRKQLQAFAGEQKTLIFFESPKRILRLLHEIASVMGDRYAVLSREMTKLHEEFVRGPVSEIIRVLEQRPEIKGECTLVVSGAGDPEKMSMDTLREEIAAALETAAESPSGISKRIAEKYGLSRSRVYEEVMRAKGKGHRADESTNPTRINRKDERFT